MKVDVFAVLNAFIYVVGIAGIIKWKVADAGLRIFIVLVWIGCINEILSLVLVAYGFQTVLNNNIYALIEAILLLWYLKTVIFSSVNKSLFLFFGLLFLFIWFFEIFIYGSFYKLLIYYRISYALGIVLLSVASINRLSIHSPVTIVKSPVFLISVGLILYFTLSVLVNAFWIWGVTQSQNFLLKIFYITLIANFISNVIFIVAILCINKRPFVSKQSEISFSN